MQTSDKFVILILVFCFIIATAVFVGKPTDIPEDNSLEIFPIKILVSWYNPLFDDNLIPLPETMANGEHWKDWMNKGAIACPVELEFGTKVIIGDRVYTCKDRDALSVKTDSYYVIDILTNNPVYENGVIVDGYYFIP